MKSPWSSWSDVLKDRGRTHILRRFKALLFHVVSCCVMLFPNVLMTFLLEDIPHDPGSHVSNLLLMWSYLFVHSKMTIRETWLVTKRYGFSNVWTSSSPMINFGSVSSASMASICDGPWIRSPRGARHCPGWTSRWRRPWTGSGWTLNDRRSKMTRSSTDWIQDENGFDFFWYTLIWCWWNWQKIIMSIWHPYPLRRGGLKNLVYFLKIITYLPHKAVAEVSKDKEPIGRECAEFNWFESQLMSDSNELRFKWFWLSVFVRDFLQNWSFEAQKRSISARLPSKTKLWRSKTKLFCETSFKIEALKLKNEAFLRDFPSKTKLWRSKTKLFCETSFKIEALKLKNEAFLRDFLQKRSFEDQKRSFSARLPSKLNLWSSKTKLFCETSFKNEAFKLQNEAFLRDFLQKWSFEAQKRSISARLPSKLTFWADTWPQNSNTF